ncbi:hypothetical protein BLAT2472_10033 [Burkholderia latens]
MATKKIPCKTRIASSIGHIEKDPSIISPQKLKLPAHL